MKNKKKLENTLIYWGIFNVGGSENESFLLSDLLSEGSFIFPISS
jgi:hypothetical protein